MVIISILNVFLLLLLILTVEFCPLFLRMICQSLVSQDRPLALELELELLLPVPEEEPLYMLYLIFSWLLQFGELEFYLAFLDIFLGFCFELRNYAVLLISDKFLV